MLRRWLSGGGIWRARDIHRAAALYLSPRSVAMARGSRRGDRFVLDLRADAIPQLADAGAMMREQGRQLELGSVPCNVVLAPALYSLSLVERPDVPRDELKEAVRWRLQDTVDFPVEQAAIDVFELPQSASRDRAMVFVVALQRDALKRMLDIVHGAGINAVSVDVTELALRNVAHGLYPEPDRSVALLRLTAGSGVINVSRSDELFLSRRISGIPAELSQDAWEGFSDRLLLQVQRSIDYYESAMGQPPCNALIVSTTEGWQDKVCEYLNEMLPVAVRSLRDELSALYDITLHNPEPQVIDWNDPTTAQRNALTAALPAMGGLLRTLHERSDDAVEAAA
jgi:MSHA biogenesis protein MshI